MRKYTSITKTYFLVCFCLISLNPAFSQNFDLPKIPDYDSLEIRSWKEKIFEKTFLKNSEKILHIKYEMFYDSVYTFFTGDNVSIYQFKDSTMYERLYHKPSFIVQEEKQGVDGRILEKGQSFMLRHLEDINYPPTYKYKFGPWKIDSLGIVNFSTLEIDSKPILPTPNESINRSIEKAWDIIRKSFGKKFTKKYIRIVLDQCLFADGYPSSPTFPYGRSIFYDHQKIVLSDLSFEFVIDEHRFKCINIRLDSAQNLIGQQEFKDYSTTEYMTQGLVQNDFKDFHQTIRNWKKLAKKNNFDIESIKFNVFFKWIPAEDQEIYGQLVFILEERIQTKNLEDGYDVTIRQLHVNPWTGESSSKNIGGGIRKSPLD